MPINKQAIESLSAMRRQAVINSQANTDEQALQVQSLYPEWDGFAAGEELAAGMRINYKGTLDMAQR